MKEVRGDAAVQKRKQPPFQEAASPANRECKKQLGTLHPTLPWGYLLGLLALADESVLTTGMTSLSWSGLRKSLRKEVIQPQVLLRLPCYDFVPVTDLAVGTAEMQRLRALSAPMT